MFNSQYLGEMGIPQQESPPKMEFSEQGKPVFVLSSKEISYNHKEFPNDTAKQAANRLFPLLKTSMLTHMTKKNPVSIRLRSHGEYPEREITFTTDGINHNYEVSTWTWWLLHHLEERIKKDF